MKEAEARNSELEARIHSLENERQTLRKEIEEARERFTQSATFSKEREFLGLREIINKKEKDILDLRDALDAKDRQILDHKDKIRRARSRAARSGRELARVRAQPGRRQRAGRRAGAGQPEVRRAREGRSRRGSTTRTRSCARRARRSTGSRSAWRRRTRAARGENERLRADAESRLAEAEETHRAELAELNDEHGQAMASAEGARQGELPAPIESVIRAEHLRAAQAVIAEEQAAGRRAAAGVGRSGRPARSTRRRIGSAREEQAGRSPPRSARRTRCLPSRRSAITATRSWPCVLCLRRKSWQPRRSGASADIAEQEARRVPELEAGETRCCGELQARDEAEHTRVTDISSPALAIPPRRPS